MTILPPWWLILTAFILVVGCAALCLCALFLYSLVVNLLRRNEQWEMSVWGRGGYVQGKGGESPPERRGVGPEGIGGLLGLTPQPRRRDRTTTK